MPGQRSTLESIPEEEDDFYLLMTDVLERSCSIGHHATLPPNIVQVTSHPRVLAPQPQYGNTALDNRKPDQTQNLLDFIRERTQTRLDQTDISVETNKFGGVIPPESKYSVPPHALPSYDGQVGLGFIATAFGFSMSSSTARDLEKFLSRNLSVITCLIFNIVPNPDLIFDDESDNSRRGLSINRPGGKEFNKALLRAIQQQEWTHPGVKEAVRLSMTDEVGALAILAKKMASHILPDVSYKMIEMVGEEPALEDLGSHKLHEMAVQQMRENRPYSLLRHVAKPGEVVL